MVVFFSFSLYTDYFLPPKFAMP